MGNDVSIILTTRNTFHYTKLAYESIRKYYPSIEIVILDDDSNDGTISWIESLKDENLIKWYNKTGKQLGHTITYNIGAEIATKEIICVFHSDMVCSPNFITNLIKHLKPKTIVSGTRIEPPVYNSDDAKISKDFGIYIKDFKQKEFLEFVEEKQIEYKDKITKGFFAPWIMYRDEYLRCGGMDLLYKPFPVEDSDFINRLYLGGYEIVQSKDSFCYHWCSRSHRWSVDKVKVDTEEFKKHQNRSGRNFLRKWGNIPKNDSFSHPMIDKKYNIGFIVKNCNTFEVPYVLEPWCSNLYIDNESLIKEYINKEQSETLFDLSKRIKSIKENIPNNDIIIEFDIYQLQNNQSLLFLFNLSDTLSEMKDTGDFEYDIFKIKINKLDTYEKHLIHLDDPYYTDQLVIKR